MKNFKLALIFALVTINTVAFACPGGHIRTLTYKGETIAEINLSKNSIELKREGAGYESVVAYDADEYEKILDNKFVSGTTICLGGYHIDQECPEPLIFLEDMGTKYPSFSNMAQLSVSIKYDLSNTDSPVLDYDITDLRVKRGGCGKEIESK